MSIKRAGMAATLILMLFLLTGGYYVQVMNINLSNNECNNANKNVT